MSDLAIESAAKAVAGANFNENFEATFNVGDVTVRVNDDDKVATIQKGEETWVFTSEYDFHERRMYHQVKKENSNEIVAREIEKGIRECAIQRVFGEALWSICG
jgi:hypothetical protein